jgi:hypothetical protein
MSLGRFFRKCATASRTKQETATTATNANTNPNPNNNNNDIKNIYIKIITLIQFFYNTNYLKMLIRAYKLNRKEITRRLTMKMFYSG